MSSYYRLSPPPAEDLTSFKLMSQLDFIVAERKRLQKIKDRPDLLWIKKWLSKSDDEHLCEQEEAHYCDVCGQIPPMIMVSEFSLCHEYDCGLDICPECIKKLYSIVKEI